MKALPKRKGNLMELISPSESLLTLNESPSKKEGKLPPLTPFVFFLLPSMKALPKRKGNLCQHLRVPFGLGSLNESPSKKEGKSLSLITSTLLSAPQ